MKVVGLRTIGSLNSTCWARSFVATALLVVAAVGVTQGPAFAAYPQAPTGALTCQLGGTMSFNPPLLPGNGTPGVSTEAVTIAQTLTGCMGTAALAVLVPSSATSISTKTVKIKATKIGKTKYAGGCATIVDSLVAASNNSKIAWDNGIRNTKTLVVGKSLLPQFPAGSGERGLQTTGSAAGSFPGPITSTAFFTLTSSQALQACIDGTGPSLSSVDIDAATSSWTDGTDVLTSGSIGGANVSVGDSIDAPIPSTTGTFLSCSSGTASVMVTSNPTAPGAAGLETTGLSLGTCTQSGANANVSFGLPSPGSVSDAVGLAFSLGTVSVSVSVPTFHEMCGYTVDLSGGASNIANAATFSNRPLKFTGGTIQCPEIGVISLSMSPLTDASDVNGPLVFVN